MNSASISSVRAELISIPVEPSVSFSTRTVLHREYVLVTVSVEDDGYEGIGYTYAGNSGGQIVTEIVNELIAPILLGRDPADAERNWRDVYQELLLIGRRGAVIRALSAVDIAAWDLVGKRNGRSVRELLGGISTPIPAYGSGGYYRPGDPLENVAAELQRYRDLGFSDFKIKFGRLSLTEDVRRVEIARETIGDGSRLALDINNGWRDVTEAIRAIRAVSDHDIWWVEEPFLPDDIRSHAALAKASPVPIATGEIEATRWAFGELLEQRAADIIQPDACVCGGITEWMRISKTAETLGVPVAPHWHANLHAQLSPATPNCLTVEYFALEEGIYNFEAIIATPLEIQDGEIRLNGLPGIGVDIDPDALARFRIA